jgi:hypothetical protein
MFQNIHTDSGYSEAVTSYTRSMRHYSIQFYSVFTTRNQESTGSANRPEAPSLWRGRAHGLPPPVTPQLTTSLGLSPCYWSDCLIRPTERLLIWITTIMSIICVMPFSALKVNLESLKSINRCAFRFNRDLIQSLTLSSLISTNVFKEDIPGTDTFIRGSLGVWPAGLWTSRSTTPHWGKTPAVGTTLPKMHRGQWVGWWRTAAADMTTAQRWDEWPQLHWDGGECFVDMCNCE